MKKDISRLMTLQIAVTIALSFTQCTNIIKRTFTDSHNSANSLDWNGTYKNTLPCVDCSGTVTEITLDTAQKYILKKRYLNKGEPIPKSTEESGHFSWNKAGNTIRLLNLKNRPNQYFVGENRLWALDKKGNKITGNDAVLNKVITDGTMPKRHPLTGNWELESITGSPMTFHELYPRKKPTIIFDTLNNLVSGNTSCNNFVGKLSNDE